MEGVLVKVASSRAHSTGSPYGSSSAIWYTLSMQAYRNTLEDVVCRCCNRYKYIMKIKTFILRVCSQLCSIGRPRAPSQLHRLYRSKGVFGSLPNHAKTHLAIVMAVPHVQTRFAVILASRTAAILSQYKFCAKACQDYGKWFLRHTYGTAKPAAWCVLVIDQTGPKLCTSATKRLLLLGCLVFDLPHHPLGNLGWGKLAYFPQNFKYTMCPSFHAWSAVLNIVIAVFHT